ncbi:MAG: hypothetical protein WA435_01800 [Gallionellaceae bacterium]
MKKNEHAITVTVNPPIYGVQSSFDVGFTTALEMLHIIGMGKWESTAPPPGKVGLYDGMELENSQQARLQYLLIGIGLINPEKTYSTLAVKTRNDRSMDSKITANRPTQGLPLLGHWHLDCCLNLGQKLEIVRALRYIGYSQRFIEIARRFVAGQPICGDNA